MGENFYYFGIKFCFLHTHKTPNMPCELKSTNTHTQHAQTQNTKKHKGKNMRDNFYDFGIKFCLLSTHKTPNMPYELTSTNTHSHTTRRNTEHTETQT